MSFPPSVRRLVLAAAAVWGASGDLQAVTEPPPEPARLGLYEWMGVAPIVIAADIGAVKGKLVQVSVRAGVKGGLAVGAVALIDQRRANRDRDFGTPALDLRTGTPYLLLLRRSSRETKESHPVFDIVREARGARALPPEGSAATIDAAVRLGQVQERANDDVLWATLPSFLEETNPLLVDEALELYVKFRRETIALAPILQPLLEHPRPDVRRRAALLLGRVLGRPGSAGMPDRARIVGELIGRARRDDEASVRREATAALAAAPDPGIDEALRTIASDDPDQNVRFEAEKTLSQRSRGSSPKRSD